MKCIKVANVGLNGRPVGLGSINLRIKPNLNPNQLLNRAERRGIYPYAPILAELLVRKVNSTENNNIITIW